MKRWLALIALLVASGAALYYSQRHKRETRVGPEGMLHALADAQREISRVPAGMVRLPDDEEIRTGNAMAAEYSTVFHTGWNEQTDPAIERYVNVVGRHVALYAQRKLDYRFHYIPNVNFVNAFALPGGHVFVGKGLMLLMDSEDELANILGHEVEHVDRYQCNERVALQARLHNVPLSRLVQLPIVLFETGYSKDEELEADRDGTYLAVQAGYSPQGAIRMFQAFDRLHRHYLSNPTSPDQEASQVMMQSIAGYFRSHPLPREREREIRELIAEKKWPEIKERALRVQLSAAKIE
jgi:predicted Zn-dependent protease